MAERLEGQTGNGPAADAALPSLRRVRRPKSLTLMVADQLRELIVSGRIDMGEQLSENVLADRLGVSRTPVREAFMRLAAEQMVEVRPQRGTFVFTCTEDEVREICELRAILETGALRLGAARDRAGLVDALERSLARGEAALALGPEAYQPCDSEFHDTLMGFAANGHLVEAYARIKGRVQTLRYRYTRDLDQVRESQETHAEVVANLAKGDDTTAEAVLREHVHKSFRVFHLLFLRDPRVAADRKTTARKQEAS
jgi:DNA-binding GntR family transcriptional regulator